MGPPTKAVQEAVHPLVRTMAGKRALETAAERYEDKAAAQRAVAAVVTAELETRYQMLYRDSDS